MENCSLFNCSCLAYVLWSKSSLKCQICRHVFQNICQILDERWSQLNKARQLGHFGLNNFAKFLFARKLKSKLGRIIFVFFIRVLMHEMVAANFDVLGAFEVKKRIGCCTYHNFLFCLSSN